jgi:hypothetical protein
LVTPSARRFSSVGTTRLRVIRIHVEFSSGANAGIDEHGHGHGHEPGSYFRPRGLTRACCKRPPPPVLVRVLVLVLDELARIEYAYEYEYEHEIGVSQQALTN